MTADLQDRPPSRRATAGADTWLDIADLIEEFGRAERPGWTEQPGPGEWPTPNETSGYYLGVELDRVW